MKRDLDFCREILLHVEGLSAGLVRLDEENFPERDPDEIDYHVRLLVDAGLLDGPGNGTVQGLTWKGHEFLDAARDDTMWNRAKGVVKEKAGGAAFDLVKDTLLELGKRAVFGALGIG